MITNFFAAGIAAAKKRPKTLNRKTSPPEKTKDPETKKTEKSKT